MRIESAYLVSALIALTALSSCRLGDVPGTRRTADMRWERASAEFREQMAERGVESSDAESVASTRIPVRYVTLAGAPVEAPLTVLDVRDLVTGVPSFAAPEMGLVSPSGGLEREPGEITYVAAIEPELLEELVRAGVEPGTWDEEGNSVVVENGQLIVKRK